MFVLAYLIVKFLLVVSSLSFVAFYYPGWGRTGYNRPGASVLQEASLPVAQEDKCRAYMRYWGTVTSKMVCDKLLLYSTQLRGVALVLNSVARVKFQPSAIWFVPCPEGFSPGTPVFFPPEKKSIFTNSNSIRMEDLHVALSLYGFLSLHLLLEY